MKQFLLGITLLTLGHLANAEEILPPQPIPCEPTYTLNLIFDCPSGPGWMRVRWVNAAGKGHYRDVYTGSKKACNDQKATLLKLRTSVSKPSLFAICTAYKWQARFQLDGFGNYTNLPAQSYDSVEECLADAEVIMKTN